MGAWEARYGRLPPACSVHGKGAGVSFSVSRSLLLTLSGNALVMLLSVAIGGLTARLLGVEGKGALAAIQLLPHVVFVIAVMGVHEATVYHVARGDFPTDAVLGGALLLTAPLALAGMALSVALTPLILHHYASSIVFASQVYALFIAVALVHGVLQRLLQGKGLFGWWNSFRVGLQFGSLAVLLGIWAAGRLDPTWYAYGILLLNVVVLLLALTILAHLRLLRAGVAWESVRSLWHYAWRAGVGNVPQLLNARLDQVLIAALLTTQSLGLYSTAVGWSLGFVPFADAYANVIFPRVASESRDSGPANLARFLRIGMTLLAVACVAYLAITPLAFRVIFGAAFTPALPSAAVLVLAALLLSVNALLSVGLKGRGHPLAVSVSEVVGLVVTVALVVVLVRRYDFFGAALASLAAYSVTTVMLLIGVRRYVKPTWGDLLVMRREDWALLLRLAGRLRG
jgi:O-antigen/teichoic acid export membrane protein